MFEEASYGAHDSLTRPAFSKKYPWLIAHPPSQASVK
jgi:hypothetical protein